MGDDCSWARQGAGKGDDWNEGLFSLIGIFQSWKKVTSPENVEKTLLIWSSSDAAQLQSDLQARTDQVTVLFYFWKRRFAIIEARI